VDDLLVREALMYAIDRQRVVDEIIKVNNPDAEVLNCGLVAIPGQGPWCETTPFARFTYDPERAKSILESDGYDCLSMPCTKNGHPLTVEYSTVATNIRKTATQESLIVAALDAGFELVARNGEGPPISVTCPAYSVGIVECGRLGAPDPSVTDFLSCDQVPPKADPFAGFNFTGWCDPEADALMAASDRELDPELRLSILNQLYALEAKDFVSLPLYVVPVISAWRNDQIAGPIGLYNSSPYGLFFNMNEWYAASA
jgi:peptide/nickel transport system substrate-binding protein